MATTRPAAQSTIIKRPRLTKLLDESEARILLLWAPAGYGKTTLAREWIETQDTRATWYRGGIEMLDAAAVGRALVDAAREVGLPEEAAARLTARAARTVRPVDLGRAISASMPAAVDSVLVIDDYHHAAESSDSEALLGAFAETTDLRILITSRTRPTWLTSRMEVYGDAFVLEAGELAFTDEEASAVMGGTALQPDSFAAQARGWPAVIGLAARQKDARPARADALLPAELYAYFAEDLFRRAPAELRKSLFLLALTGATESQVTHELLGKDYDDHLVAAAERGFVSRGTGVQFEMHPLLRAFLLTKLHEPTEADSGELVDRALRSLGRDHRWDDCLAVLDEFPGTALAVSLLEEALDELLATGRVATVKRWLSLVPRAVQAEHPVVLLAEAEVAAREGRDGDAQTIAEHAAENSASSELAARAHLVAARAAHMLCNDFGAVANARRAASLTKVVHLRTDALRVELMSAIESEDGRASELLTALRKQRSSSPDEALLLRQASAFLLNDGGRRCQVRDA